MFITKHVAIIQYKLNQLAIRERLGVLLCALLLPLLIWDLLLYETQNKLSSSIADKITLVSQQSQLMNIEKMRIENQLKHPKTKQWLNKYHDLKNKILGYKKNITNYKQQTLSEQKLVVMLNSIFNEIKDLTMVGFVSIRDPKDKTKQKKSLEKNLSNNLIRKYYKLNLRGGYFALMSYLVKIEALPWQLYWDEMSYQVVSYPTAELKIIFHAMSKEND